MREFKGAVAAITAAAVVALSAPVEAATCRQYQVAIDVIAASTFGQRRAQLQEFAVVRDQGFRNNPFEFFLLIPGDPNQQAGPGSIELLTNSRFARNPGIASQAFDLAQTGTDAQNVNRFQLIPEASFILPSPNVLVVPGAGSSEGGLSGECFAPGLRALCDELRSTAVLSAAFVVARQGAGAFLLLDNFNTIQGEYVLEGSAPDNPNFQGAHQAVFQGPLVNSFRC